MFPVAIQQTQTNVEESTASTLVQAAARSLEESLTSADLPATGDNSGPGNYPQFLRLSSIYDPSANPKIQPNHDLWQKTRGAFILPQDPRFAWTALYKRNPGDSFAQVIIFALQCRNQPAYTATATASGFSDIDPIPPNGFATFEPRYLDAILTNDPNGDGKDFIEFTDIGPMNFLRDAIAEGCFVVIGNDNVAADDTATPWFDPGYANGRIYRIGNRAGGHVWELMPGHDMQSAAENLPFVAADPKPQVWVIGKGFLDISTTPPDTTFTGFAQDIAVYSTFIRLK
jgi:hypothetical protein